MTPPYRVGDELPPLEIPVTRTLIVAGAIASRDYQDVHHDAASAREKGSPDIFMNILTTNGLVGRYITDHFGPTAVLRKVAIRLGAPNYPGDVLRLTGRITELRTADTSSADASPGDASSDEVVDAVEAIEAVVQVTGGNGIGRHVTGTVAVTLPEPSAKRTGA
ncbi:MULTISPECIES: MaoC/PaaZ C-terminal domain-containing protein [Streptomyces]|uniref:MaoC/PaaZ C-terminal domain-containing protein n=1 Tax=Streptomyces TaxID=1883 RepID=UPI0004BD3396|nr:MULTISPECIES: MaoC/PaaZ C-terminal domain-containing protein [Streptomyces]KOG84753.1 acyl dehydratase [Streptomyces griseus subsp. rhodochrous]